MGWKIEVLTNESNYSYCVEELNNEAQNRENFFFLSFSKLLKD